jgi:hypothetical protein
MRRAVFGEALGEFGIHFGGCGRNRSGRRRQVDGFDLPDGDGASALLMGGGG